MKNSGTPSGNDTNTKPATHAPVKPAADAATDLNAFFTDCLKDIYWAENALVQALPKMAANATSANLSSAIKDHLAVTKNHVARLE
ncbi:MAG: DUF892 family protein, partial [Proteobacteria bacterium]